MYIFILLSFIDLLTYGSIYLLTYSLICSSTMHILILLSFTHLCNYLCLAYSLTHSLTLSLTTYLLTVVLAYSRISEQRQDLEIEQLERGIYSASSSDEEADFLPHCRQGYEESSASESDLPEIPGGEVSYGNACDFD